MSSKFAEGVEKQWHPACDRGLGARAESALASFLCDHTLEKNLGFAWEQSLAPTSGLTWPCDVDKKYVSNPGSDMGQHDLAS